MTGFCDGERARWGGRAFPLSKRPPPPTPPRFDIVPRKLFAFPTGPCDQPFVGVELGALFPPFVDGPFEPELLKPRGPEGRVDGAGKRWSLVVSGNLAYWL